MSSQLLFFIAFTAQIVIISILLPRVILGRMRFVTDHYPPDRYPRLYPRSLDYYDSKRAIYAWSNGLIALIGAVSLASLLAVPHHYDIDNTVALIYFLLQSIPQIWLDLTLRKELKAMRDLDTRSTRTAPLNPRRLFDVMSPLLFWAVAGVYLAFWVFTTWFRQFEFEWFGGYLNNAIITAMNVVFGAILIWRMYGRRLDPHQSDDDRLRQLRRLALLLGLTSIAVTVFATLTIGLSAAEAKAFRPLAASFYYQLLAVISLQAYRIDTIDFDVYRDNGDVAAT